MEEFAEIKSANDKMMELFSNGKNLRNLYKFIAQNSHLSLFDAYHILLKNPNASLCFSFEEWNAVGRRIVRGSKSISYIDEDGNKQYLFDISDTYGNAHYQRLFVPLKRIFEGLDELNGTGFAGHSTDDFSVIRQGVAAQLIESDLYTGDDKTDRAIEEGVACILYAKTSFPKFSKTEISPLPYDDPQENAELITKIVRASESILANIEDNYAERQAAVDVINDIDEETVSDEVPTIEEVKPKFKSSVQTIETVSPIYKQYLDLKEKNPDSFVVIRLGDFYELFDEDARLAADIAELTLTSRDVGLEARIPMVGFPYHVSELYFNKLLEVKSVLYFEDGKEYKILSEKEVKGQAVTSDDIDSDEEEEIDIDESELDDSFEDDEEEEEEEVVAIDTSKPRIGMHQRKRKTVPQLSLFDLLGETPTQEDLKEQMIEKRLKQFGTDSKLYVYDYYLKNPTEKEFAVYLKNSYGTGGFFGTEQEQWNDPKGIKMRRRDPNTHEIIAEAFLKWEQVANRIADLIDDNNYLTEQEKAIYIQIVKRRDERARAKNDDELIQIITRQMIEFGLNNTRTGSFEIQPYRFEEAAQFIRTHRKEFDAALLSSPEVLNIIPTAFPYADNYLVEFDPRYCPNLKENTINTPPQTVQNEGNESDIKVGDRFVYKDKTVTVTDLKGLYPNDVVISYDRVDGDIEVNTHTNVDKSDLLKNGTRIQDVVDLTDLKEVGFDQKELGGAKARFKGNIAAIKLAKTLAANNRAATLEERKTLVKYVGWGGLSTAFDANNESWAKEYAELKNLLTEDEYERARGSTLNAHYTSKEVIDAMYNALERFGVRGNNRILEPAMGTGNFFGFMPKEIADGSKLYGVELDNITGQISKKLYPSANIQIKGFEEVNFVNDYFDIVVSNVPFGGYSVYDRNYSRYNFLIHDYFLAKSIDKMRPGGIMAVVTSAGTMDKINPSARKYMADRAELIGAIRLPNTAFKQTAGTEVVTDILFLKKREEPINATVDNSEWLATSENEQGYVINNYFISHPDMILGTLSKEHGLYGAEDVTVNPDGRDLSEALSAAIQKLPTDIYNNPEKIIDDSDDKRIEAEIDDKQLCYKDVNGKLYMRVGNWLVEQEVPSYPKDAYERICAMIHLREEIRNILDIQVEGCSDAELEKAQALLNKHYDSFVKKYGRLTSKTNARLFNDDGDSALLLAAEDVDEESKTVSKADIFTKRTIRPYVPIVKTDDCYEALQICLNEKGSVDIAFIEELTSKDYDAVINELTNAVFRDPELCVEGDKYSGFVTAEEYLSGNVVKKLEVAKQYIEGNSATEFQKNVIALEKVQPEPLTASEISVRLGASWIDPKYYKEFYCDLVGVPIYLRQYVEVSFNPFDSSWTVKQNASVASTTSINQRNVFGTERASAIRLFEDCLNLKAVNIYDTFEEDGKEKRVLNQPQTLAARDKQNKIKQKFKEWIFANPQRRYDLEATYNRMFNQTRLPKYDGSYLTFPEMNPAIELKPHQKDAVHRIISSKGSTLLHHVVGAGKTYTMAAAIMKMKQFGICNKAMIAVPNHLVQQWACEFRKLYPNAKLLIADKEDLEKDNRQKFVSKVAMGDWDAIIIAQSSFAKIPISKERQKNKIREEISNIESAIRGASEGKSFGSVKKLEQIKKQKKKQLDKLLDDSKKDSVLTFESLGVDYLFIDEAHYYKNLFLYTKMNNVVGISTAASQRASDLKLKCEYLQELHHSDKGVVFATGTPISNSMTEMYAMQTYLQPNVLKNLKISYFDGWAANFGETITSLELKPSGQGYQARTRFAKFTNLPELLSLYRQFADVQTSDMVKLDVPKANRKIITLKPSDTIIDLAEQIAARADYINAGGIDPHDDNMLKVTSDGKKLALDPRCFDRNEKDEEGSKLNACAEQVFEIWQDTKDKKGTQIIFCDLSTPKKKYEDYIYGVDFDVYNDLKYKLVQKGIPEDEIAYIHDANSDEQKQALFDKVNSGSIRVLIGSTEKCGAGTNIQKKLVALHHLDTPYRPSDMQQREGRIIRQGNTNDEVDIYTYITERTFDSYSYQILENKQRFISQIDKGDLTQREADDIDDRTLSYAEIKAIAADNPKIKRKMEVDTQIAQLRVLEGQYRKNIYVLQDKINKELPDAIRRQELFIERITEDIKQLGKYDKDEFSITVNGKEYTDKKEGAKALTDALYASIPNKVVAIYRGFSISMDPMDMLFSQRTVSVVGNGRYTVEIGESANGNIQRLNNFFNDMPVMQKNARSKLDKLKNDMIIAQQQVELPFEKEQDLLDLLAEQEQLDEELSLKKKEEDVIIDDEKDEQDENYMGVVSRHHNRFTDKMANDKQKIEQISPLPDYSVTQEQLSDIGYNKEDMLPVSPFKGRLYRALGIPIYELSDNDMVRIAKSIDGEAENVCFGIKPDDWQRFLNTQTAVEYLSARYIFSNAAGTTIHRDFAYSKDNFGEYTTAVDRENSDLMVYLSDHDKPNTRTMRRYLKGLYNEHISHFINSLNDEIYNKDYIKDVYIHNIEDPEIQGIIKDKLDYSCKREILDSVNAEWDKFENDMLSSSQLDIFRNNYQIYVKNELHECLNETDLLKDKDLEPFIEFKGNILDLLYNDYISDEFASLNTYMETAEFIKSSADYIREQLEYKPIDRFEILLEQGLKEIKWLEGRTTDIKEDELNDILDDLKDYYEDTPYAPDDISAYDYWYDDFADAELIPHLENRLAKDSVDYRQLVKDSVSAEAEALMPYQADKEKVQFYDRIHTFVNETMDEMDGIDDHVLEEMSGSAPYVLQNLYDYYRWLDSANIATDEGIVDLFTDYAIAHNEFEKLQGKTEVTDMPNEAENQVAQQQKINWRYVKVPKEAMIGEYQYSSLFAMPRNGKYAGYAYYIFNDRIKESDMYDSEYEERIPAYVLRINKDDEIRLSNKDGEKITVSVAEFMNTIKGATVEDYEINSKPYVNVSIPQEAILKEYENSTLFSMPLNSAYKGGTFFTPNVFIREDTDNEDGRVIINVPEDFEFNVRRKDEEDTKLGIDELKEIIGKATVTDYPVAGAGNGEQAFEGSPTTDNGWRYVNVDKNAIIATYDESTLFRMPKGEYENYMYYIGNVFIKENKNGQTVRVGIPESFEVRLKSGDDKLTMSADEYVQSVKDKTAEDYEGEFYRKPSEKNIKKFESIENNLRKNAPSEMLNRPNWVVVRTKANDRTGRLDKFLIDVHTGKFAESDNPATWTDFESACKYAKENGGVALAYALDGKDKIACFDLDNCKNKDGNFGELAEQIRKASGGTYYEKSISGNGIHFFGKTNGNDVRAFSKDGKAEYYQGNHFITMTGNGEGNLFSFDTHEMQEIIKSNFDKRTPIPNAGKGIEGLTSMSDRELIERASSAKNGDTFQRLYNGEDIKNNHSNSDMSLMNLLAFWSGHDINQMLRIFASSGLFRNDKPMSYYEHTAIKAIHDTPAYTPPTPSNIKPPKNNSNGNGKK